MSTQLDHEAAVQSHQMDFDEGVPLTAEELADLIEIDPVAIAELRRLIMEGLESIEDATEEADDEWLESLAEGVRQRAASRSSDRQ